MTLSEYLSKSGETLNEYLSRKKREEQGKTTLADYISRTRAEVATTDISDIYGTFEKGGYIDRGTIDSYKKRLDDYIGKYSKVYNQSSEDAKSYLENLKQLQKGINQYHDYAFSFDTDEAFEDYYKKTQFGKDLYDKATSAEDFNKYAGIGADIKNPTMKEVEGWMSVGKFRVGGKDVGNIVTYSRDHYAELRMGAANSTQLIGDARYSNLKDDEVAVYNYWLAKENEGTVAKGTAQSYLDAMDDTLNQREAGVMAESIDGKLGLSLVFGAAAGLSQFANGVKNLFDFKSDYIAPTLTEYASQKVRENLGDVGGEFLGSSAGQIAYDAVTTTANMLPTMMVSAITGGTAGPILGTSLMGLSAGGNYYKEFLNSGMSKGQARALSTALGVWEGASEYFLGSIEKISGNKIAEKLGKTAIIGNLKSSASGFTRALMRFFDGAVDVMQEGGEEVIQDIGSKVIKLAMTGEWEGVDLEEEAYNFTLGALTAGLMNTPINGIENTVNDITLYRNGRAIKNMGGVDALKNLAVETANEYKGNELVSRYAENVAKKPTAMNVGILNAKVNEVRNQNNLKSIENNLIEQMVKDGVKVKEAKENAGKIAEILLQEYNGTSVTLEKALKNPSVKKVYDNVIKNKDSEINLRDEHHAEVRQGIVRDFVRGKIEKAEAEKALSSKFSSTENGKTINTKTGEEIRLASKEVVVSNESGKMTLRLEDGNTVSASDVGFSSKGEAVLFATIEDMGVDTHIANSLLESVAGADSKNMISVAFGLRDAFWYGSKGVNYNELEGGVFTSKLTEQQRKTAYNLGKTDAIYATSKKAAPGRIMQGKVYQGEHKITNGRINDAKFKHLNDQQKSGLGLAKMLSKLGANVYVFESTLEQRRNGMDNGWHVSSDGSIHIDLNSGTIDGEGLVAYTVTHEFVHDMEVRSPVLFKRYADLLFEELGYDKVRVTDMMNAELEMVRAKEEYKNLSNKKKRAIAYSDVVAKCSEKIFTDTDVLQKFADRIAKTDKTLLQKIVDFFKSIIDRIRGDYDGQTANSYLGNEAIDTIKRVEAIRDAFVDAMVDTVRSYQRDAASQLEQASGEVDIDGDPSVHLKSVRSMVEGAGLYFEYNENTGEVTVLDRKGGNKITKVTPEQIRRSPLGNIVGIAERNGFVSAKEAQKQVGFLTDLVNMCLDYKENFTMVWEIAGTQVFSAIKMNSDVQYGKTIDFSTVCKKTQQIINVMSETQKRLKRGLTREEVKNVLYKETGKAGEPTPCPVCYVFSRWMGIGGILQQMYDFQKKYEGVSEEEMIRFINEVESEIISRANTPNKNGKLKADFFDKNGKPKLGTVIADLKQKATSKINSAKKAIAKNAETKLKIQEAEALLKNADAKQANKIRGSIEKLRRKLADDSVLQKRLADAEAVMSRYEEYQWLTKTYMDEVVSDDGSHLGWKKDENFKPVDDDTLFDLREGAKFATKYPKSWKYRTTKGCNAGKAILPYSDARVGETIQGIAYASVKNIEVGEANAFLNGDLKAQDNYVKNAIKKQLAQNLIGGMRYQSTSDFRYEYGSDYLITFLEMQAIGAKVQLYTKVIEAVDFLCTVGADVNLSVMPLGDGYVTLEDGRKQLIFSSVTGINAKAAIEKTRQYDNAQLILVGINDEHIRLALKGDDVNGDVVTFVIPFHGSGNTVNTIKELMDLIEEDLDVTTAKDYSLVQTDHFKKHRTEEQKALWELRKKIITRPDGWNGILTAKEYSLLEGESGKYLKDLYNRFFVDETAEEYGVSLSAAQAEQIFPYEYWDKSLTYEEADQNGERFKEYCETMGIVPRFSGEDSSGKKLGYGDFTKDKGYWKLLIDRKMYNNDGTFHVQRKINVTNFEINSIDPSFGSVTYGDVMQKDTNPKKTNAIVDRVIEQLEEVKKYSEREDISNRTLLANALETVAQNDIEKSKLKQYKTKIGLMEQEEKKLSDIKAKVKELSFAKGHRNAERISNLQKTAKEIEGRINRYDKQLFHLEASDPLKKVLAREYEKAKKAKAKKYQESLDAYRKRSAETVRTIIQKNQESRKKAIEGRNKTEVRDKVKKVVSELNQYLKDNKVLIGMQKIVAEALDAINMDTVDADERVAKYDALIAKQTDPGMVEELIKTRDRIAQQGEHLNDKLQRLKTAYADIINSDDPLIANSHDEVIESKIDDVIQKVGNTSIRNMTLDQLEEVYDMYKMILTSVRQANKAFKMEKAESVAQLGDAVIGQVKDVGGYHDREVSKFRWLKKFGWKSLKPIYAMRMIGSDTFTELYQNIRNGEDSWYRDMAEAKAFKDEQYKKHGYSGWDFKKQYPFTSKSGKAFHMTLEQIMSLYAYSKRPQAIDHLIQGGIVFDSSIEVVEKKNGIPIKYNVNTATAFNLSEVIIAEIIGTLSEEQRAFVDEMQAYLSEVMAEKGNEVSLAMYGVKLFKEKVYFPLRSASQFMYQQNEVAGEVRIKNSGFSKSTVAHANNPILLNNFMDVWAGHCNNMAMYHSFVLPLEDFNRVWNYKTKTDDKVETMSVKQTLQDAYGAGVNEYISTLLTDLNGGARQSGAEEIGKMMSLAKKGAVFVSASVTIQQPSAICRAMAYISPKYFVKNVIRAFNFKQHSSDWAECKRYAPVAGIKEMGYFDTGMGHSSVVWLKSEEYEGFRNKLSAFFKDGNYRDEILSKAPSLADELTWCFIWNATKSWVADTTTLEGEDLLTEAGKRFTEVITLTQVYDSVLSRSGLMRSKDTGTKMATAFMAEPTTTMNMVADAIVTGRRMGGKQGAKIVSRVTGAVVGSIVLNALLKSVVVAWRHTGDDDDETYIEKYGKAFIEDFLDNINPLTYIPFVKDIVSIFQGYTVDRMDMALFEDLANALKSIDSSSKSTYQKVTGIIGSVASFFGLPIKNIERDLRPLIKKIIDAFR